MDLNEIFRKKPYNYKSIYSIGGAPLLADEPPLLLLGAIWQLVTLII